jgi:hypothetical protein
MGRGSLRHFSAAFVAILLGAAPAHAVGDVAQFLIDAIELCTDPGRSVSAQINQLSKDGWTTVHHSERLLDIWTQGDLATFARTTTDDKTILEGYAKWRAMAVKWVANRTKSTVSVSNVTSGIDRYPDTPGSIGLLMQHQDWPGVFEIQMRWTQNDQPANALSCLFISEQSFPESIVEIGPELAPPTVIYDTETQVYVATEGVTALPQGATLHMERRLVRLTEDHWAGVTSDVRVKSVLIVKISPRG